MPARAATPLCHLVPQRLASFPGDSAPRLDPAQKEAIREIVCDMLTAAAVRVEEARRDTREKAHHG
jgi:hypothetical protein